MPRPRPDPKSLPGISKKPGSDAVSFPAAASPAKSTHACNCHFLKELGRAPPRDSTRGNVDVTHAMCVTMCSLVGVDLLASQWQCTRRSCAASNRPLGRTTCMRTCSPPSQWPAQCCSCHEHFSQHSLSLATIRSFATERKRVRSTLSHCLTQVTVRLSCILALGNWSAA